MTCELSLHTVGMNYTETSVSAERDNSTGREMEVSWGGLLGGGGADESSECSPIGRGSAVIPPPLTDL